MKTISFIGIGHMGAPMALNLIKAGYAVTVYDLDPNLIATLSAQGARVAKSLQETAANADIVITMLPAGEQVLNVYLGETGLFKAATSKTIFIDCSTIDMATARQLHHEADLKQLILFDAPVSGGTVGAAAGILTFMVGGDKKQYEAIVPVLNAMGKKIFYAGAAGSGQAAKICNNMLLGISMIGVCEAFNLADKLGLDTQTFYDIAAVSSGQCWSLTSYCPVPGPIPTSPANHDYKAGFAVKMMLKDLKLAQQAAVESGAKTPLGAEAMALYTLLYNQGLQDKDFSIFYSWLTEAIPK